MRILETSLADVKIIEPAVFGDDRGFFMETWSQRAFAEHGIDHNFVQDNHSRSACGVLRGMHYQIKHPQGKLVRSSSQFGQWVGVNLSDTNKRQMWVPPGFAHGFLVLSASADFQYKCTDIYSPENERSLIWNDPDVGIEWPFDQMHNPSHDESHEPQLAEKDKAACRLGDCDTFN